jgi:hypothetical protein
MYALWLAAGYSLAGICFAVWFVTVGAARLDTAAIGAGVAFRCVIAPGAVALWPYLLYLVNRSKE